MNTKKPKAIAMYLPQFYETDYNSAWWGDGFTDWVSMKNAEPLFKGHYQPRKPLNDYRYNLLEKETMMWQANLMHEYDVYGLCIYHYWFKDGQKVLELPAENLLSWKDIEMPYCFCWANESWVRSWSNVPVGNVWSSLLETSNEKDEEKSVLMQQDYGGINDWKNHFNYLLPFFKDDRYIKKDNKPIFLFYRIDEILCIDEMLECWNQWAQDEGLDGIYVIGRNYANKNIRRLNAEFAMEPILTTREYYPNRFENEIHSEIAKYISYDELWKHTLQREPYSNKTYWCGCVGYDSTPRRGKYGAVVYNNTPEKFKIYLTELMAKTAANENDFFFINAWNEWGEGMYLEPDEKNEYAYLEAFKYAYEHYEDEIYKYISKGKKDIQETSLIENLHREVGRYIQETKMLNQWLYNERSGYKMEEWLWVRGYHTVGVYGLGYLGKQLINELTRNSRIKIVGIDRNAAGIKMDIDIYEPSEVLPDMDIVIVSNMHIFDTIKETLQHAVRCEIEPLNLILEKMNRV